MQKTTQVEAQQPLSAKLVKIYFRAFCVFCGNLGEKLEECVDNV